VLGQIVRRANLLARQLLSAIRLTSLPLASLLSFRILITGDSSGLVETITDSVSVHSIKKAEYGRRIALGHSIASGVSLYDHFLTVYGPPTSKAFLLAQRNFIRSLAGYSVATYLLQIKDRHNGNILIDREGHVIHIDFGFMLSNSPGNMGFEAAPFKLTWEYVDIMGGVESEGFRYYKKLFKEGFEAARKHSDEIITIVELMQTRESNFFFPSV
jgi:phosphatidylinositol kinase/protein kinase (PI-3  family)